MMPGAANVRDRFVSPRSFGLSYFYCSRVHIVIRKWMGAECGFQLDQVTPQKLKICQAAGAESHPQSHGSGSPHDRGSRAANDAPTEPRTNTIAHPSCNSGMLTVSSDARSSAGVSRGAEIRLTNHQRSWRLCNESHLPLRLFATNNKSCCPLCCCDLVPAPRPPPPTVQPCSRSRPWPPRC